MPAPRPANARHRAAYFHVARGRRQDRTASSGPRQGTLRFLGTTGSQATKPKPSGAAKGAREAKMEEEVNRDHPCNPIPEEIVRQGFCRPKPADQVQRRLDVPREERQRRLLEKSEEHEREEGKLLIGIKHWTVLKDEELPAGPMDCDPNVRYRIVPVDNYPGRQKEFQYLKKLKVDVSKYKDSEECDGEDEGGVENEGDMENGNDMENGRDTEKGGDYEDERDEENGVGEGVEVAVTKSSKTPEAKAARKRTAAKATAEPAGVGRAGLPREDEGRGKGKGKRKGVHGDDGPSKKRGSRAGGGKGEEKQSKKRGGGEGGKEGEGSGKKRRGGEGGKGRKSGGGVGAGGDGEDEENIDIENAPAPLLFPKPGEEKRFARLKNDPSRLAQCQEFRRKFLEKYPEDWVYSEGDHRLEDFWELPFTTNDDNGDSFLAERIVDEDTREGASRFRVKFWKWELEPLWLPEETLTEDQLRNWYDEDKEELKRWRREKRKAERKQ